MLEEADHHHQPQSLQHGRAHRTWLEHRCRRDGRTLHPSHRARPHQGPAHNDAEGRRNVRGGREEAQASQVVGLHPTGRRHLPHLLGEPAPHSRVVEGEGEWQHAVHLL